MKEISFVLRRDFTGKAERIPYVDESQMREVDRIAVEDFGLGILQMMENAGRNLANLAMRFRPQGQTDFEAGKIVVAAGTGGNGGGGLCAVRHLHNRGVPVSVLLTKPAGEYTGPAGVQLNILMQAGITPLLPDMAALELESASLVLDALIGYSLKGAPRGTVQNLIEAINHARCPVLALDLPSGLDATTGEIPGAVVAADATLTLALPKPGLINPVCGDLYLADIGISPEVYHPLGIRFSPFFGDDSIVPLRRS